MAIIKHNGAGRRPTMSNPTKNTESNLLTDRILDLLNEDDHSHSEDDMNRHLNALLKALGAVVGSINCPDCRQKTRENIEAALPGSLDRAMQGRAELDAKLVEASDA
jgi:hypothetical protein